MKDKIKSLLQGAWSSTLNGVDIDKATNSVLDEIVTILADVELRHEKQLEELESEIGELEFENKRLEDCSDYWEEEATELKDTIYDLREQLKDTESFESDMEASNSLLEDCLPELNRLLEINSNNPNKYRELNQLIYRIEEQIIKNAK